MTIPTSFKISWNCCILMYVISFSKSATLVVPYESVNLCSISGNHDLEVLQCICCCHLASILLCFSHPKYDRFEACRHGQENYTLVWSEQDITWTHYLKNLITRKQSKKMEHSTHTKHANTRCWFLSSLTCMVTVSGCMRGGNGKMEKTAFGRSFINCTPSNIMRVLK